MGGGGVWCGVWCVVCGEGGGDDGARVLTALMRSMGDRNPKIIVFFFFYFVGCP